MTAGAPPVSHVRTSELEKHFEKACHTCQEDITMGLVRLTQRWVALEPVPCDSKIERLFIRHRCNRGG